MTFFQKIFMAFLVMIFITGCSQSTKPAAEKSITLLLDWFVNPDHAPIFVAQQQGFFKRQGLNVNIIPPADPSDGLKMVAAGKADIALSYQSSLLQSIDNELPLVWVGTVFNTKLDSLAVLKTSAIKTLADLKGKTIGSSDIEADKATIRTLLKSSGLRLEDVKLVNVHYNLVQALLSHQVDAISGIMRNVEPIEMQLAGHPARLFNPEDYGVPQAASEIFIVNRQQASQPWVAQFMLAIKQAIAYLKAHPEESFQRFAADHPELNNALNKQSWMVTYPYFANDPYQYDAKSAKAFAQFMFDNQLIRHIPQARSYIGMP